MSSNATAHFSPPAQGRIIIGPKSMGLGELTLSSSRQSTLSIEAEDHYLERVRKKAQDMAKEILAQAMVEAEELRRQAEEKGMKEGISKADAEVKKIKEKASRECTALLDSMRKAGQTVWRSHRQDLVMLVRAVVEKILSVELERNRQESMASLLDQAVDMMDVKRRMVVTVHPRDQKLIEDLLHQPKAGEGGLEHCKVKTDEGIELGGLILECDHGMVDNTIASRIAGLKEILDQLSLEEPA